MERVFARIDVPIERDDGSFVLFERKKQIIGNYGETARHEALHIVADPQRVVSATIKPGPGYQGATWFSGKVSPAAAAAAHAFDCDGTSHDLSLIEGNVGSAVREARSILRGKEREVAAVASALEASGTLSGNALRSIINDARKAPEVVMLIISRQGKIKEEKTLSASVDDFSIPLTADLLKAT